MSAIHQKQQSIEFNLKLYREEVILIVSLKTVFENLNLVNIYDKANPNVFIFSLQDKYRWGLTFLASIFSQFVFKKVCF